MLADKLNLNLIFSVTKGVLEQISVLVCLPIKIVSNYCMSPHFAHHSLQVIICSASPINMHVNSTVLPNRPVQYSLIVQLNNRISCTCTSNLSA